MGKLNKPIKQLLPNDNKIICGFIYIIKNKTNDKIYIGQTTRSLNKRIWEYKYAYNTNTFHNQYLSNAFHKYGWDNFEFSIIDTATTINELNQKEVKYIQQYKSNNRKFGYNIELGGNNAIPSIETLEKMSKSHQGIKQTNRWIENRIAEAGSEEAKKYGRAKTEEEKQELRIKSPKFWQGKKRDDETKRKISETKRKQGLSDKQKENICKKVYKINLIDNTIKSFESTENASIFENVNQSTISRWCSKNKTINNILWSYNKI